MSRTVIEPSPAGLTRACAFTLATALAWIGHVCKGGCPILITATPASVWHVRDQSRADHGRSDILVIVDLGNQSAPPEQIRALLREVNRCTAGDHIRVYERADNDHAQPRISTRVPQARGVLSYLRPTDSLLPPRATEPHTLLRRRF